MNKQMEQEISEAIKKGLSSEVGEMLQQTLEQGKRDSEMVKSQASQMVSLNANISVLNGQIEKYKELDTRNAGLVARELAVAEKERNQKVFEAELKLAEAEKRATEICNFTGMVFKSPIYRKSVMESETWGQMYLNNGGSAPIKQTSSKTETTQED